MTCTWCDAASTRTWTDICGCCDYPACDTCAADPSAAVERLESEQRQIPDAVVDEIAAMLKGVDGPEDLKHYRSAAKYASTFMHLDGRHRYLSGPYQPSPFLDLAPPEVELTDAEIAALAGEPGTLIRNRKQRRRLMAEMNRGLRRARHSAAREAESQRLQGNLVVTAGGFGR